jgi:putative glutathione S-transferase
MGMLIDGRWTEADQDYAGKSGEFERSATQFRDAVVDAPDARFRPEVGRYHLFYADACPWCHRVMIARAVFGLEDVIRAHKVSPWMLAQSWTFTEEGADSDPLYGIDHIHELYSRADPSYTGRVTVPVLWDTVHETIVNNESSELIRMLDDAFRPLHTHDVPRWHTDALDEAIEAINPWVYDHINNGVYKSGFAGNQAAYERAVTALFEALDRAEALLDGRDYLVADHPTEADWRLWVTLIRFDLVYFGHFKCNLRPLSAYPNLFAFTKRLYDLPNVAKTVDFDGIKTHYYGSHESINPRRIVPVGPDDPLRSGPTG